MFIQSHIVGDVDIRGRYLPTALLRIHNLSDFTNFAGSSISLEDLNLLSTAYRIEHGEHYDEEEIPPMGIWDAVWEILEGLEGYSRIYEDGTEWSIRRNYNGDIVLVDESAVDALSHNIREVCEVCEGVYDYQEVDESDLYWLGDEGGLIEDECYDCGKFTRLKPVCDKPEFERDLEGIKARNMDER